MTALATVVLAAAVQAGADRPDLPGAVARFQAGDCQGVVVILSDKTSDPREGDLPYVLLAACYLQLGRVSEGIKTARGGLAVHPQSGLLRRMLGQQVFREDPYSPEAGALLEGAMMALPGDPESRHYFAQWAYMNNRDKDCVQREREAVGTPGSSPVALLQMQTLIGMCEGRSGDPDAARVAFETAWTINRTLPQFDAASAYRYARFLSDHAETDQLKTILAEVLVHAPRYGPVLVERAKLLRQEGKMQEAIDTASLALNGDGNDADSIREAHLVLARSYFMLGQLEKAAAEQEWVDAHPVVPAR